MAWETNARIDRWWAAIAVILLALAPAHAATTQPTTRPVKFDLSLATVEEGRAAIADESTEPYFKLMQPLEMAAKTGSPVPGKDLAEQQENCRQRYQDAVHEFTPAEKDALGWYVSKLAAYTYPKYPLLAATPWKFIKLGADLPKTAVPIAPPAIEGGNPFTRGQYICLSSFTTNDIVKEMNNSITGGSDWTAMGAYAKVLLHEQMHVLQRAHPDRFARFYTDVWGFSHAASIAADPWLTEHQMLDPDGVDQNWVYPLKSGNATQWIVPRTIIGDVNNPEGPRFSDMRIVAINLQPGENGAYAVKQLRNDTPSMTPLFNVQDYVNKFKPSHETFHPNEISAELFAHVTLMLDILPSMAPPVAAPALNKAREEYKPLHEAFMNLLGDKK